MKLSSVNAISPFFAKKRRVLASSWLLLNPADPLITGALSSVSQDWPLRSGWHSTRQETQPCNLLHLSTFGYKGRRSAKNETDR